MIEDDEKDDIFQYLMHDCTHCLDSIEEKKQEVCSFCKYKIYDDCWAGDCPK